MSIRPVVFVKYFDKGSTVLGGHQMAAALSELGVETRCVYADELGDIRDSILVFIKKGDLHHLARARRAGNLLVLDVQDTLCFKRRLKNRRFYHGIIFRSQKALDDYGGGGDRSVKIYLQWNRSFQPNRVGDLEFRLAYLGDPRSFSYWDRFPQVPCIPENRFFEEARDYNCHISIRTAPRDVLYKPTCKVSTAAACEANLITTRDDASVELLGPDYPYYTESDPESILEAIAHARTTFGGPEWRAARAQLETVKESHDLDLIARQYLSFFSRLDGNGSHP